MPAKNIAELIALAKAKPDALTYGSAGNGSSSHLSGALFESIAGVKMLHVPYKGSSPLLVDVLSGRVDMTFDSYTVYEEHIKAARCACSASRRRRAWARCRRCRRSPSRACAGYDVSNWLGVLAPAGTPKDVIATLHGALGKAMATPALKQQLVALGIEPTFGTPDEFTALMRAELPKWAEIVRKSGATID